MVLRFPAPFPQLSGYEIDYSLMLFDAAVHDRERLPEGEVDGHCWVDPAEILKAPAITPGIGLECHRHRRHSRSFGKLDPDRIKLFMVEDRRPRRLWKDDDRQAGFKTLDASLQDGFQVITCVGTAYGNGVPRTHHILKNRIFYEALLDDECRILDRRDDHGENKGLQRTHVITYKHAGTSEVTKVVNSRNLDEDPNLLERTQGR